MNRNEFIGKLQMVYVGDRNAFNEIVEDNQKLKNEVVYSKVEIDRLNKLLDETRLSELHKEYIINELEKWVKEDVKEEKPDLYFQVLRKIDILNKLKALKENNKDG